jgi:serine/threonine-protein kinase HipA
MSQKAKVYAFNKFAGILEKNDEGKYTFAYDSEYLNSKSPKPISLTMPIKDKYYESTLLFPFFDGLIPEGWLLNIAVKNWKINSRDKMALLLNACRDCIGAVHIEPFESDSNDIK